MPTCRNGRKSNWLGLIWILQVNNIVGHSTSTKLHSNPEFVSCCALMEYPSQLLTCTNDSSVSNRKKQKKQGLNIGLVTYATSNIHSYAAYSIAVNEAYADHRNYSFTILDEETSNFEPRDSRWNKVKILSEELIAQPDLDFLMWVDADLIFLDFSFRLEDIISNNSDAHLIISAEHSGSVTLVNSGSVLVRNSPFTHSFLRDWWAQGDQRLLFSDQEQFDLLYQRRRVADVSELRRKVAILPPNVLNSDPPAMIKLKPNDAVLHLMGEEERYRVRVFRAALEEVCRHYQQATRAEPGTVEASTLAPQLTVTQQQLHHWALEEYAVEAREQLAVYRGRAPTKAAVKGKQGVQREYLASHLASHSTDTSRTLANTVHHYAFALEKVRSSFNFEVDAVKKALSEARVLRRLVYFLLFASLRARRERLWEDISRESSAESVPVRYPDDWPEMLKVVATAGQHLMGDGELHERQAMGRDLLVLLEELFELARVEQRPAVSHMIAHLHTQIGVNYLEEHHHHQEQNTNDGKGTETPVSLNGDAGTSEQKEMELVPLDKALSHCQTALNISESLAVASGPHILVLPLTLYGNILSVQRQHDRAFDSYRRALDLAEQHLGVKHPSVGQILVNHGVSLVQSVQLLVSGSGQRTTEDKEECRMRLSEAISLFERFAELRHEDLVLVGRASEYSHKAIQALDQL